MYHNVRVIQRDRTHDDSSTFNSWTRVWQHLASHRGTRDTLLTFVTAPIHHTLPIYSYSYSSLETTYVPKAQPTEAAQTCDTLKDKKTESADERREQPAATQGIPKTSVRHHHPTVHPCRCPIPSFNPMLSGGGLFPLDVSGVAAGLAEGVRFVCSKKAPKAWGKPRNKEPSY